MFCQTVISIHLNIFFSTTISIFHSHRKFHLFISLSRAVFSTHYVFLSSCRHFSFMGKDKSPNNSHLISLFSVTVSFFHSLSENKNLLDNAYFHQIIVYSFCFKIRNGPCVAFSEKFHLPMFCRTVISIHIHDDNVNLS